MIYSVRLTRAASFDLVRLAAYLEERSSEAADRSGVLLRAAIESLAVMPARHPRIEGAMHRELRVPFGSGGYVVRYRIDGEQVVITRVFHMREDR